VTSVSSEMEAAAVELRTLSKTFGGRKGPPVRAVDNLTLSIGAGEVFGLLGPNGAGKTTTIKLMSGLVTPTSGTALLNGYDIARQRSAAVLQIGAVLEGGRNVYWTMTAWQNLLYFGRLKGLRGEDIRPRAERLLKDLGLWERRNEPVGGFSRGMQQKVAIAAALITDPPILLLDEPTIGLDVQAARTVRQWITHLAHGEGKTIVMTTHQLNVVQELCDRVAIIRDGIIAADLPLTSLLEQFREDRYAVSVAARLDDDRLVLPDGAAVVHGNGTTTLTVPTDSHRELYTVLDQLRDLDAPVESVNRVAPNLEDVFIQLISGGK
jgi:ABC-2 type transport system ATP-binding protein